MHTIMWTFQIPAGKTKEEMRSVIKATAHNYLNIDGLVRKYYGIAEDGRTLVGIYLWNSKESADRFYTPTWIQNMTERWGAAPLRAEWETPMVVEIAEGRLLPA